MDRSRTRTLLTGLIFTATMCGFLPGSTTASAASGSSVSVAGVNFYNGRHFRLRPCTALGAPQTVFHNSARNIYDYVHYSRWQGKHSDLDRWYSPDGNLFHQDNPLVYTGHGPLADCSFIRLAGTRAGNLLLGKWTYQLVVDGKVAYTAHFTVTKAP